MRQRRTRGHVAGKRKEQTQAGVCTRAVDGKLREKFLEGTDQIRRLVSVCTREQLMDVKGLGKKLCEAGKKGSHSH